jgi:uncharacterized membrane protein
MKRIASIDIVRGIVMVIMALDHVRDLMHVDSVAQSPTNLETTTPALFFTRWITYLCAPAFVFLAGTSAFISFTHKKDLAQSRSFLLKRGLYLVLLEFIVVNFAIFFDAGYHIIIFEVIAAIGVGFIVLGLLLKASAKTIGSIGLLIIFLHGLVPLIPLSDNSTVKTILQFLFSQTAAPVLSGRVFVMAYPPVPWLGLMLVGFAAGKFFQWPVQKRQALFVKLGILSLVVFVLLRFINVYGDTAPWSVQKDAVFSFLSFMNVTKYPPSLQFCLVTIGILFLMLAAAERSKNKLTEFVSVYGRVPLFYFLVHFFVIHLLLLVLLFAQGFSWQQLQFASGSFGRPAGVTSGLPLGVVYLVWMGVVLLLYKPCLWYGRHKSTHRHWWLRYL